MKNCLLYNEFTFIILSQICRSPKLFRCYEMECLYMWLLASVQFPISLSDLVLQVITDHSIPKYINILNMKGGTNGKFSICLNIHLMFKWWLNIESAKIEWSKNIGAIFLPCWSS